MGRIFLAVLLGGLLAAYGRIVAEVGTLLTVILVLSLSTHAGSATAGLRRQAPCLAE